MCIESKAVGNWPAYDLAKGPLERVLKPLAASYSREGEAPAEPGTRVLTQLGDATTARQEPLPPQPRLDLPPCYAVGDLVLPVAEVVRLLAPNSHEFGYGHF